MLDAPLSPIFFIIEVSLDTRHKSQVQRYFLGASNLLALLQILDKSAKKLYHVTCKKGSCTCTSKSTKESRFIYEASQLNRNSYSKRLRMVKCLSFSSYPTSFDDLFLRSIVDCRRCLGLKGWKGALSCTTPASRMIAPSPVHILSGEALDEHVLLH
jgi:hypothetical protein